MENKRERFVRIAESRTNKILNMIKILGNCSNKSSYEYTDKDVDKIFNAIELELREAKKRFNTQEHKTSIRFSLREE
jgi:murein L,D-transpeptidase YafK